MRTIDKIIRGLAIIAKYEGAYIVAEHDQIYAGPKNHRDVSDLDLLELESLGWEFNEDINNWGRWV